MKVIGITSTATLSLSLLLGIAAPGYAQQEGADQQQEQLRLGSMPRVSAL